MKNLQKLGKALNKAEQKQINGGEYKGGPCGSLGGTLMLGWSEVKCNNAGGIWHGGKCWVCFS